MFDLESVSRRLTQNLLKDIQIDHVQQAKIEYGMSLVLGVAIELILTVGVSFLLGTAIYTLIIMLSALVLRLHTGGAHCSSFRRCYVFTLIVFVLVSLIIKFMVVNLEFKALMGLSIVLAIISLALIWKPKRFTLWVWMFFIGLPSWGLISSTGASWLAILALSTAAGLIVQAFMGNTTGQKFVQLSDKIMQHLGI